MRNDNIDKMEREMAKRLEEEREYVKAFPLSQYSTSELKAELRRRKRGE